MPSLVVGEAGTDVRWTDESGGKVRRLDVAFFVTAWAFVSALSGLARIVLPNAAVWAGGVHSRPIAETRA